jgi:hypothetical protein
LEDWHPEVRTLAAEAGERVGKHADDGGRFLVDVDDAADDGRVATEAALPEAVTQHHGRGRAGIAISRGI